MEIKILYVANENAIEKLNIISLHTVVFRKIKFV